MIKKNINFLKIIFILKEIYGPINTGDLADETKINHKNIGRYLSKLEEMGYIEREVYQEGKKRFIMNSLIIRGKNYEIHPFYRGLLEKFYY